MELLTNEPTDFGMTAHLQDATRAPGSYPAALELLLWWLEAPLVGERS